MGVHLDLSSVFQAGNSVGVHSLLPKLILYNGATKSAGVDSFLPTIFRQQSRGEGIHLLKGAAARNY